MPVASRSVPRRVLLLLSLSAISALALALVTVMVAVPSAADAAELPRTAMRREVERSVHASYPDLAFGNVACPSSVRRARAVAFTCTVQLPGTFLVVDAEQTDGHGTVALSTQQAVIPTQKLRDFVAQSASLPATVDCGPAPFRVARSGQTITCHVAMADGTAHDVDLAVQDTAGTVTLAAVR